MAERTYFTEGTFAFLKDLAANNDREWFKANKGRYEEEVKEPALRFIVDFSSHLRSLSPHFRADPRANGGSLFRIYRDTRFSKDKSPFKTHTGIQFRHDQGRDAHAPGFYLHVDPEGCFAGLGIWRPDGNTLRRIREAIAEDSEGWNRAVSNSAFRKRLELSGDRLVRPPRGFAPDHPFVEDLKRKDFVAVAPLTKAQVTRSGFVEEFAGYCRAGESLISFLCEALDLPY